jgi:hypothetical protein
MSADILSFLKTDTKSLKNEKQCWPTLNDFLKTGIKSLKKCEIMSADIEKKIGILNIPQNPQKSSNPTNFTKNPQKSPKIIPKNNPQKSSRILKNPPKSLNIRSTNTLKNT